MSKPLFTIFPTFADASHFVMNLQQFQFSIFCEQNTVSSFCIVVYSEKKLVNFMKNIL